MIIKRSTRVIMLLFIGHSSILLTTMIILDVITRAGGSPLANSDASLSLADPSISNLFVGNETLPPATDNSSAFSSRASFLPAADSYNDSTSIYVHNQSSPEASDNARQQYSNHRTNDSTLAYHPNHQSYPAEPYPSSSYTSLSNSLSSHFNPSGLSNSNNQPTTTSSQNPFFTRDNHQSASFSYPQHQSSQSDNYNENTFGNQASSSNNIYNYNHNYDNQLSGLNTGLIQNLSSSLFPVKQLNNATLQTLSELLNKTKQAAAATSSSNYYRNKSTYSINNNNNNNNNFFSPSQYATSGYSSTLSTNYPSLADTSGQSITDQYSILDYIRPNQFGLREPSSVGGYQQQASFYPKTGGSSGSSSYSHNHRPPAQSFPNHQYNSHQSGNNYYDNNANYQPSSYKTASNIYNTYMPFKESLNSMPSMTNGQTLAMAIYDNLLDNGYRLPSLLMSNSYKQPPGTFMPTSGAQAKWPPASGYQYVQQHNMNNQNHLDKVTYHSTPFRPSIANPPPSSSTTPLTTPSSNAGSTVSSDSSSTIQQRPRTEAGNKSISFASLSSSSSAVSSDSKADQSYSTNGQAITGNRFASSVSIRQSSTNNNGNNKDKSSEADPELEIKTNSTGEPEGVFLKEGSSQNKSSMSSLTSGQAILLDLYEREIDNQIREAIYGDALHTSADQLLSLTSRPQQTTLGWPTSVYDEPLTDQTLASWLRPVSSRPTGSSYLATATTKLRPTTTTLTGASLGFHTDPLATALQELPTFSASDLQPMYPSNPAGYPALPGSSSDILTNALADSSLSSLNSQLLANFAHQHQSLSGYDKSTSKIKHPSKKPVSSTLQASGNSAYLPTILLKLHSSPLSSILSNPLNHFYSSKHRDKKKPTSSSLSSQQPQGSATSQYSQIASANSFLGSPLNNKNILSIFQTSPQPSSPAPTELHKNPFENQQAALAAAAATASLIAAATAAAEENSLSPLQAALMQTSNVIQPSIDQSSLLAALDQAVSASRPASSSLVAPQTSGGHFSPLIWRNMLSPTLWTRKQFPSGQNNPTQTLSGSHNKYTDKQTSPLNSLMAGNGLGTYLYNSLPSASTVQAQLSNTSGNSPVNSKKPAKLKIRILKIPVAFYDQPTGIGDTSQTTLLPAQMQPSSLAASLLASMSCPLAHASPQLPHTLDQHLLRQQQSAVANQQATAMALGALLPSTVSLTGLTGNVAQPSLGLNSQSSQPSSSFGAINSSTSPRHTTVSNSSSGEPNQFTDINQPNDLQVSPTSLQVNHIKTLR